MPGAPSSPRGALAREAARWQARAGAGRPTRLPALVLMTDEARLPDPGPAILALPRGAAVILRHYGWTRDAREHLGRRLRALTRRSGVLLLVAADIGLAVRLRADGMHWPDAALARARGTRMRYPHWVMTGAVHGGAALHAARAAGLDAVILSPAFPTASHPGAPGLGPVKLAQLAGRAHAAALALGGVTAQTARRLRGIPGLAGLAAIGGLTPDQSERAVSK